MTDPTDALIADIIANPSDRLPCDAMADLLLERGDDRRASAYRWMARTGKRPARWREPPMGDGWAWLSKTRLSHTPFSLGLRARSADRRRARLDADVLRDWGYHRTFGQAVEWLALRLDALRIILEGPK